MKKIFASLIFVGTTLLSISYGASIGDISLRFCNNSGTLEKTLFLNTSGQQEQPICMTLINGGTEKADITMSFVDGTITNDADQKKACKNEGEIENFGQYVQLKDKTISVPARGSATTTAKLVLPEEKAGEIHGCVTYFIANQKNKKEMFTIMVRRASFVDILAKGVVTVGLEFVNVENKTTSISKNPKIASFFDDKENKLYIQSTLRNKGTAEQGVTIKGTIKNRFGYKKVFFEEKRTIFAKQTAEINSVIDDLPFYKGPFTITYDIEHTANVSSGLETNNEEKNGTLTESTQITVITKETYITLAIIIAIIAGGTFVLARRKAKGKKATHKETEHHTTKKAKHK